MAGLRFLDGDWAGAGQERGEQGRARVKKAQDGSWDGAGLGRNRGQGRSKAGLES